MSQIEIQTFVFMNIGVTGTWEEVQRLSRNKLCLKPVSREELFSGTVALDENIELFLFEKVDKDYKEGLHLLEYDLYFTDEEAERLLRYLDSFPKPIALVGYSCFANFFPTLRAALGHSGRSMPEGLRCIDTMQSFYEITNHFGPQTPRDDGKLPWQFCYAPWLNYQFPETYQRLTGKSYNLTVNRPILQSECEKGVVIPHIKMNIECCLAILDAFKYWVDLATSSTIFNEGTLLPHECPRRPYDM